MATFVPPMMTFVPPTERPDSFEYPDNMPQPPALSGLTRVRLRDWWRGRSGLRWLWVEAGSWREFGWRWYVRTYGWRAPFRVFRLGGRLADLRYYAACRLRAALAELVKCVEAEASLRTQGLAYRGAALETVKRQVEKLPATLRYAKQLLADEGGR